MEITDLFNADTIKLTLIPGVVVALVLFFWFRRSTPKGPLRSRELARGRNEGADPLLDEAEQWEVGEVRIIRDEDDRESIPRQPLRVEAESAPPAEPVREPRPRVMSVPPPSAGRNSPPPAAEGGNDDTTAPSTAMSSSGYSAAATAPKAASVTPAAVHKERGREQNSQPGARQSEGAGLMLVLNVVVNGRHLRGAPILKAVTAAGLTFGKMGIFHYYAPSRQGRQPLFSLANMVEPGSFNLATMDELSTPGLTLFANVTSPDEGVSTFNAMLETARKLADALHATVCDERRSTLSRQGIEHIHGRIQDFQRRSRLAHAANA